MRKALFYFLFLFLAKNISAQLSVRVYNYRPTGDYGAIFKPTLSAEIGIVKPFEDHWVRPVFLGTIINLRPRQAEFPITGEMEDGNGLTVYPGTESYKLFLMVQLHAGIDVAVIKKEKFHAFLGTSVIFGEALAHYHAIIPKLSDEEGIVGGTELGIQMRAGVQYEVNDDLGIFLTANRDFYFMTGSDIGGFYWANDYGIGVSYKF